MKTGKIIKLFKINLCIENENDSNFINSPTFIIVIIAVNLIVLLIGLGLIIFGWKIIRDRGKAKSTKILPIIRTKKFRYSNKINKFDHSECVICLEPFVKNCEVTKIEACEHILHSKCLEELNKVKKNKLFRSKCPLCKIFI